MQGLDVVVKFSNSSIVKGTPDMRNMRFRSLGFWGLVVLMFLAEASSSWAQVEAKAVVVRATKHVVVPPLSQIVPISPESGQPSSLSDDDVLLMHQPRATRPLQDSVLQPSSNQSAVSPFLRLSTNSGLNILGQGTGFPGYTVNNNTSDPNGAVGPTQFVQFVNDSFTVFNKSSGSVAFGPAKGNTLWQALGGPCAANPNLDEIVQFDKIANRWVMLMPVFQAPSAFCFAVSTTSDAVNGGWNLYAFSEPGNKICNCRMQPDYPKLAVWPDGYYLTYNQGWNGNFEGPAACVVDRNSMLSGAAATMQCFNSISATYGTLLPADVDGTTPPPGGSPEYYLNFDYGNNQSLDLWQFHVDWTTPTNSTFTGPTNIPVAPFTEACGETVTQLNYTTGACIPQAGTAQGLDSYGDRLMYRLAYRNFGTHESLVTNHTVTTGTNGSQTGIRWYELQSTGAGFGLFQQGTYAPDSSYRWMGSIAMDKAGDMALGYSVSSATMSPSIGYTGRLFSDPLGVMESEIDVLSSAGIPHGSRTNNFRWSDYSSLAIDPTDDCTFWYTSEYMPTNGGNWSTRIASFSFPTCTQTASLRVSELGQGTVTSTDGTINCTNGSGTCGASYATGSSVTMNATAAAGWAFSGWSGSCNGGNPCSLVMNSNLTATATFKQNFTLTVNEVSQGTVTSTDGAINCTNGSGSCSAVYASGSSVTLNATPASGLIFAGWSGACSGGNPCNLVMNSNLTATATFATGVPNYTLTVSEVGQGTVTSTDGAINCTNGSGSCSAIYVSGSSVTLNATAATGFTFMGWSAPCSGRNSCSMVMNSNLTATATFVTTPTWAIVRKTTKAGAITSITIPATGSGHLIAVALMFNGTTSVASVSDNAGDTYASAGARAASGAASVEIWYALNSVAGATVVTPTFVGAPTSVEISVWEVSGVLSLPPDSTNTATGLVTSNNTPGAAVTTTQAGDFVISLLLGINASFTTISTGNEFTNDFRIFGNGWAHITSNSSSAGTHQASWFTSTPNGGYCSSTVAFAP
jgi:hypothetical protein